MEISAVAYTTTVLHCLKHPQKAVMGLLIGKKTGDKYKVTDAIPVTHEAAPLAAPLELALGLVHHRHSNIVGVYFANAHYKDQSISTWATRLADRVSTVCGLTPLIVQVVNCNLNAAENADCLTAYIRDEEQWKNIKVVTSSETVDQLAMAVERKLYRELADFDNHLDKPDVDFFNTDLCQRLSEVI